MSSSSTATLEPSARCLQETEVVGRGGYSHVCFDADDSTKRVVPGAELG